MLLHLTMQLSWINFFMTFLATFAPAALLPLIRENLSLTKTQTGLAGENCRESDDSLTTVASSTHQTAQEHQYSSENYSHLVPQQVSPL